ncbi:MAG: PDZ domain-containing protein [Planctomycetota bacterium]
MWCLLWVAIHGAGSNDLGVATRVGRGIAGLGGGVLVGEACPTGQAAKCTSREGEREMIRGRQALRYVLSAIGKSIRVGKPFWCQRRRGEGGLARSAGCLGVLLLLLLSVAALAGGLAEASNGEPATRDGEPVERWIKQLNDQRFDVRSRGTNKLIEAGEAAVKPVLEAVKAGNLEVSTRGVYVLRRLAYSSNSAARERSLEALREIAGFAGKPATARVAREAIAGFDKAREQQALRALKRLGASIETHRPTPFAAQGQLEIEIGPGWKGELKDVKRLAWVRDLWKVTFAGSQVTDPWVESIKDLPQVKYLVIKNAKITDAALLSIGQIETLAYLDLMYSPVTDAGFEHLKDMKSIQMIRCFGTKITREAAREMARAMENAEIKHKMGGFLGVRCQPAPEPCRVILVTPGSAADQGGISRKDIITQFAGTPVPSFDELERLIARNGVGDKIEIEVLRGGQALNPRLSRPPEKPLGIEGTSTTIGVNVDQVTRGSAAAEATVRKGDLIVALDGQRISSLAQLHRHYKEKDADWSGRLFILRDAQRKTMKVALGQWNE